MSEESGQEKTLDASPGKLEEARRKGDLPTSREGSVFGLYAATLIGVALAGSLVTAEIGEILLPLLEQPEAFAEFEGRGFQLAGQAVLLALAIAVTPIFGLLVAGSLLPHFAQNAVVFVGSRIHPKLSNISPAKGVKRLLGLKSLFEFGKSLAKALAVVAACWMVGAPLYASSANLASLDPTAFLDLSREAIVAVLFAVTIVAGVVAVADIGFQRFDYARRHRMSLQEMREELRSTDGDPHVKAQQRRQQRKRSQRRMLAEVPKATVIITNPTHFAVALRYDRGKDDAPLCVAKGTDRVARRIREAATAAGVPILEERSLARALYATTEIGDSIPREHFEAVAKVIGLIWSRKSGGARGTAQPSSGSY